MKSKALSVPYLIWMCIFIIIPLGLVIYFAFTTQTGNFTLSNLFLITKYLPVLLHSIWLAFIATIICLVLGFLSHMISRAMPNKQTSLLMLMLLPMWINYLSEHTHGLHYLIKKE